MDHSSPRIPSDQRAAGKLSKPVTSEQAESSHILQTLQQTKRVINGRNSAAAKLRLLQTMLISKIQRLVLIAGKAHIFEHDCLEAALKQLTATLENRAPRGRDPSTETERELTRWRRELPRAHVKEQATA
jgi:hypothetical protein